jgi:hypothetical protein
MWYLTQSLVMFGQVAFLGTIQDVRTYPTYDACVTEQRSQVKQFMPWVLDGAYIAVCSQQKLGS